METVLSTITITLLGVVIAINLVVALIGYGHGRRMDRRSRAKAISRLYGQHFQRKNSLTSGKR
jgi:hypothetical protein